MGLRGESSELLETRGFEYTSCLWGLSNLLLEALRVLDCLDNMSPKRSPPPLAEGVDFFSGLLKGLTMATGFLSLLLLLLLKMETALSLGNIFGQTVPKVAPKAPEAEEVEGPGWSSLSSLK